tara:strand:+ start:295 stop:870 length:576 start_codon:yes stop_codon:yes gene_type:complete
MVVKKNVIIFITFSLILILILFFYTKFINKNEKQELEIKPSEDIKYNSNIITNVNYTTKDADGNEYIIRAMQGEIDYANPNILYLTNVNALIKLNNSNIVKITSDFGRYNSENFDTIFSKNVIIKYLDNKITGEYVDFSLGRNSMIISKNVVYTNFENILRADVIEMDLKTKDTKIFMHQENKKVNIKSKN